MTDNRGHFYKNNLYIRPNSARFEQNLILRVHM